MINAQILGDTQTECVFRSSATSKLRSDSKTIFFALHSRRNIIIPDNVVDLLMPSLLGPDSPSKRTNSAPASPTKQKGRKDKRHGSGRGDTSEEVPASSSAFSAPHPKRRKTKEGEDNSSAEQAPPPVTAAPSEEPTSRTDGSNLNAPSRASAPINHIVLSENSLDALDVDAILSRVNYGGPK
jgi:hypothetical protein